MAEKMREDRAARPETAGAAPRRGLLIWLSGADPETLAHSPREARKFSGLGGIVLTTSAMAGLSAGFALHSGMRAPLWISLVVAALWGLAIANLDRWLVTAATRRERWWQNGLLLVPRVLLALVIGAVVSTPLVLWIFHREIQAQLTVGQQADRESFERALRDDARFTGLPELERQVDRLQRIVDGTASGDPVGTDPTVLREQAEFDAIERRYTDEQRRAICELDGTCGTGAGYQSTMRVLDDLRRQRDVAAEELEAAKRDALGRQREAGANARISARNDLVISRAELHRLRDLRRQEQERYLADSRDDRGLLARLEALHEITERNATLKTAYLTLLIFITVIEILPVLTKFLLTVGPPTVYDQILAEAERTDVASAKTAITARAERRREVLATAADQAAVIEAELRTARLSRWRGEELRRIAEGEGGTALARRIFALPLPRRRARTGRDGYAEWPGDEPDGRVHAPADTDRTTPRWRFR